MNIAVIFYSACGNTAALASAIAEGAQGAGATVRLLRVPEIAPPSEDASPRLQGVRERMASVSIASDDDLVWADGVAFGSPTRYGNMCAELKRFIQSRRGAFGSRGRSSARWRASSAQRQRCTAVRSRRSSP